MDAILADLNPEQMRAVTHGAGPLLVVAGAGSGKTRVITRRVAHLVRQGVAPRNVIALTFTNKAAQEMRERVQAMVAAPQLWVCTFHSFAARILRRWADRVGYTAEFSIYDTEDKRRLLKEILGDLGFQDLRPAEVAQELTRLKNGLGRTQREAWRAERISQVIAAYEQRIRKQNAMDFDDLLCNAVGLLQDEQVRHSLHERLRWILVDEYQDTNSVQYTLLKGLSSGDRNLCATGDPDQSIYRWRGATIRNILDFEKDFPGAHVITLDRNYRSTKTILDAANAVIRNNTGRLEKDLRTENDQGAPVREVCCRDDQDEADSLVRMLSAWRTGGAGLDSVGVFYRTNAQSRVIERALAEAGIPYRIVGAVEFYKRREIKDLLSYVRLARNPRDDIAFLRVLNVPPRGIGARTLERIVHAALAARVPSRELLRDRSALEPLGRAHRRVEAFAVLMERLEALPPEDAGRYLEQLVQATEYREFLGAGTPMAEVDRLENIDELVNAAMQYALREPEGGIDGFLEECALVSDQDAYDPEAAAVTLMTVHSAKGLEFPRVVVTGLEERLFPHALSIDEPEEVEEERRLFYVAITRAKEELYLMHAAFRTRFGAMEPTLPSRFLCEIPDALIERDDHTDPGAGAHHAADPWDGDAVFEAEAVPLSPGDRVEHDHFGPGRVADVRLRGQSTRVTVEFDRAGRRELLLAFARLRRV